MNTKKNILKFLVSSKNIGNSENQIILLSNKINSLKDHFLNHKKDFSGKRGLLKMISHRRRLLNYLKRRNILQYNNLILKLGLRR
ncbi:30S ribosomal protein S15 [Buchnera aphidicola]|uniref:Small ribosomal subunit protein uS15 n=1 Tax=Buchnera aphidicola (Stegophylla sp.) TaxID=2315800 RepID=A0A4D6YAD8_9GAMM|nr:30S ribosomal protein S15 [Buchnera aphidicola (Stegophylla sp.)]QCI26399.1 30S ribosomal protein S15 [Buchnera aphidicola (Stegophylla sp.)]